MFGSSKASVFAVVAIVGAAILPGAAQAADLYGRPPAKAVAVAPVVDGWTIELGIEGRGQPIWEGSNRYEAVPVPIFDIRRAGTPARFRAPRDGFGLGLIDLGAFRAGPVGKLRFERKESDEAALRGLGNVDWAIEVGGFAEFWVAPWLRTRAEVRQGFNGHEGVVADVTADALWFVNPQLLLSAGPRATFASSRAESPYYSVNLAQAIASGLPQFNARGGVHSVGAGVQAQYLWTPRWTTRVFAEYERLMGDAGDSPLVSLRGSRDQVTFGGSISYSFEVPGFW